MDRTRPQSSRTRYAEIAGLGASRVQGDVSGQNPQNIPDMVKKVASQLLLSLPTGEWWTMNESLKKHLEAAMTSERIGAQHLNVTQTCSQLAKLSVVLSAEDLVQVAKALHSWRKGKGILVNPFVDGLIAVCKCLGTENERNILLVLPTPSNTMQEGIDKELWTPILKDKLAQSGLSTRTVAWQDTVEYPYFDSDGPQLDSRMNTASRETSLSGSPLSTRSLARRKDLIEAQMKRFEPFGADRSALDPSKQPKDWRMGENRPFSFGNIGIREVEARNNPAVTKTWQTIKMPTGDMLNSEQIGHYAPMTPSRLSTPEGLRGICHVGHLTNSELTVFRLLQKNKGPQAASAADVTFNQMKSFSRLATPQHKPLNSALRTRTVKRHAHLVPELCMPHLDTGLRMHESGSQTERILPLAVRNTKPSFIHAVPLLDQKSGSFRPHPTWASTGPQSWPEPLRARAEYDILSLHRSPLTTQNTQCSTQFSTPRGSANQHNAHQPSTTTALKFATTSLDVVQHVLHHGGLKR